MPSYPVLDRLAFVDVFKNATARRFANLADDHLTALLALLQVFNEPLTAERLIRSETVFNSPPLAGLVRMLEADLIIMPALLDMRFRQFVGVLVRIQMARLGWEPTGKSGSLQRLSTYFTTSERYQLRPTA